MVDGGGAGMNAIVAVNSDWGIGYGGSQTVVIPEDRQYFKKTTTGGVVIVGRKTFKDFPGPLQNRKNIILTRDRAFTVKGAIVAYSVEDVLDLVSEEEASKVFVVGGGDIYRLLLPHCINAYVTKIEAAPPSDTFFPNLDAMPEWRLESCEYGKRDAESGIEFSYNIYRNIK